MVLLLQAVREFGRGGRLARALQADEHDDVGNAAREDELRVGAAEQFGQLVEHNLHDVLRRRERIEHLSRQAAFLRARAELLHDLKVHVGLEQRQADLAHGGVDVVFGEAALAAQAGKDALQTLRQAFEHGNLRDAEGIKSV